jgi:hypothetical protein
MQDSDVLSLVGTVAGPGVDAGSDSNLDLCHNLSVLEWSTISIEGGASKLALELRPVEDGGEGKGASWGTVTVSTGKSPNFRPVML